jgi:alcohol dehydrogenase
MRFHVPTEIIFHSGALNRLRKLVRREYRVTRILLVTDQGIIQSGIADKVISQIPDMDVFDEIEPNPKSTAVNRGGELARTIKPELIIGLGGGSSLDAAKAIALLATNPGTIEEYEGRQIYTHPPLPMVAVPTTCGTGSEVTWVSVITDTQRNFKMSIKGPHLFPRAAILDPDVLVSLPRPLIASTGLDALTHALEAYTVKPRTFFTDLLAREALQLIYHSLPVAYEDIASYTPAREHLMLGSTLAGMAFGNSDVGAVHCLAETVGGLYDIPHGVANAIFLPVVMKYNLPAVTHRYATIARDLQIGDGDDDSAAQALIEEISSLSQTLHIPSFTSLSIPCDQFEEIARRSVQNNSNSSNPRKMTVSDYIVLLKTVASGSNT